MSMHRPASPGWNPPLQTERINRDTKLTEFQLLNRLKENFIRDVKFPSGIKNINFGFYPYTDVCLALYTQYEESHKTAVIQ